MAFQALRASQTTSSELKGLFKKVNDSTIPISEKNIQTNITSLKFWNNVIANFVSVIPRNIWCLKTFSYAFVDSMIPISEKNIQTNNTTLKGRNIAIANLDSVILISELCADTLQISFMSEVCFQKISHTYMSIPWFQSLKKYSNEYHISWSVEKNLLCKQQQIWLK